MNCYAIKFTNGDYLNLEYSSRDDCFVIYPVDISSATFYTNDNMKKMEAIIRGFKDGYITLKNGEKVDLLGYNDFTVDGIYKIEIKECEKAKEGI